MRGVGMGTNILMHDGTYKPINEIRPGNVTAGGMVRSVWMTDTNGYIISVIANNTQLRITPGYKILSARYGWITTKDIYENYTKLVMWGKTDQRITASKAWGCQPVYDMITDSGLFVVEGGFICRNGVQEDGTR